jgi:hypothetical protein
MIQLSTRGRVGRSVATLAASAVGAAGLAVFASAPAAHAEEAFDATLAWGISQYVMTAAPAGQFPNQTYTDGASIADGIVTFSQGAGRTDLATGATSVQYHGKAAFARTGSYEIDFTDPQVVVDSSGAGEIVADVDYTIGTGETAETGGADDVVLTTFTATSDNWDGFTLAATPAWSGVATADAYGTGKPTEASGYASWAVGSVNTLPSSVRAFFYASGSSSDAKKAPAAFTATVPGPTLTVGQSTVANDSLTIPVTGAGFSAVVNPGDAGVYVGLAPSGGLPDVSSQEAMGNFAGANWVMPTGIVDGAFTSSVTAPRSALDPSKSYSLYTWQAHAHSNTYQDTETPVSIDWSALEPVTITAGRPTLAGVAKVGGTLTARPGTWSPTGVALSYQWLVNGKAVAGATRPTYALTPALAGSRVAVTVTGTVEGAEAPVSATSAAATVAKGTLSVGKPRVTGKAKVGKRLTAVVAVPAGAKVTYQWFKGAKAIKGAKARTLKVTKALRGTKLSVKVTVTRAGYATVTTASAKTAKVKKK